MTSLPPIPSSLIEKLEALKGNWGGSNPWQEGYLKAIDKAIAIVRQHEADRYSTSSKQVQIEPICNRIAVIAEPDLEELIRIAIEGVGYAQKKDGWLVGSMTAAKAIIRMLEANGRLRKPEPLSLAKEPVSPETAPSENQPVTHVLESGESSTEGQAVASTYDAISRWATADKTVKGLREDCYLTSDGITELSAALRDRSAAELDLHRIAVAGVQERDSSRPVERAIRADGDAKLRSGCSESASSATGQPDDRRRLFEVWLNAQDREILDKLENYFDESNTADSYQAYSVASPEGVLEVVRPYLRQPERELGNCPTDPSPILEWANRNPEAVKALLEGRAGVIDMNPLDLPAGRDVASVVYGDGDEYSMATVRLDRPTKEGHREG